MEGCFRFSAPLSAGVYVQIDTIGVLHVWLRNVANGAYRLLISISASSNSNNLLIVTEQYLIEQRFDTKHFHFCPQLFRRNTLQGPFHTQSLTMPKISADRGIIVTTLLAQYIQEQK